MKHDGRWRLIVLLAVACGGFSSSASAQGWFAQVDAFVHLRPDAFETSGPPNVIGSAQRPGVRLSGGVWLSPRSTLRVEFDATRAQERVREIQVPFQGTYVTRTTNRTDVLGFLLGFHPVTPSPLHMGFLMGVGSSLTRVVQAESNPITQTTTREGETEGQPALLFGAESRWAISTHIAIVVDARLDLPFGSDRVIVRPGAGLRWTF